MSFTACVGHYVYGIKPDNVPTHGVWLVSDKPIHSALLAGPLLLHEANTLVDKIRAGVEHGYEDRVLQILLEWEETGT